LLVDLADPKEALAQWDTALENGDQEIIQLVLRHVIKA